MGVHEYHIYTLGETILFFSPLSHYRFLYKQKGYLRAKGRDLAWQGGRVVKGWTLDQTIGLSV